jgi:hypothetical protein
MDLIDVPITDIVLILELALPEGQILQGYIAPHDFGFINFHAFKFNAQKVEDPHPETVNYGGTPLPEVLGLVHFHSHFTTIPWFMNSNE